MSFDQILSSRRNIWKTTLIYFCFLQSKGIYLIILFSTRLKAVKMMIVSVEPFICTLTVAETACHVQYEPKTLRS